MKRTREDGVSDVVDCVCFVPFFCQEVVILASAEPVHMEPNSSLKPFRWDLEDVEKIARLSARHVRREEKDFQFALLYCRFQPSAI